MIISNLTTPIRIKENDYEVIFDLGFTNDEDGNILSEVTIKKIHDPKLQESYSIEVFYGNNHRHLKGLKTFLEKGLNSILLEEDFDDLEDFMSILPNYNIKLYRNLPLQEKVYNNEIIKSKVIDILKHNGNDMANLVNSIIAGTYSAFETVFKDEKELNRAKNTFAVKLMKKISRYE